MGLISSRRRAFFMFFRHLKAMQARHGNAALWSPPSIFAFGCSSPPVEKTSVYARFKYGAGRECQTFNVPRLTGGQRVVWALAPHDDPARECRAAVGFYRIPILRVPPCGAAKLKTRRAGGESKLHIFEDLSLKFLRQNGIRYMNWRTC